MAPTEPVLSLAEMPGFVKGVFCPGQIVPVFCGGGAETGIGFDVFVQADVFLVNTYGDRHLFLPPCGDDPAGSGCRPSILLM
jgi:hypothetical protein